jgi:hypothetical protein
MGDSFQTDIEVAQQWLAEQAQWMNEPDDEPEIDKPLHPLDPLTVTAMLMLICSPGANGTITWRTALRRLAVIASHILPEVGRHSLDGIAKQLTDCGIPTTRAALSITNCQLSDITGFHRTEKTQAAREAYRIAACKAWQKNPTRPSKRKKKTASP